MRVLVIGGTMLSGPYVVREVLARGHGVTVFHRGRHEVDLPEAVVHVHGDRQEPSTLRQAAQALDVDALVDMIAMNDTDAASLIEAFRGKIQRAVFISSGDVYAAYGAAMKGQPTDEPHPIAEDAPLREELHPYWAPPNYEKILMERAVMDAASKGDFPATILRYPAVYGPGAWREWYWVKRILDGRPRIALPDGGLNVFHRGYAANVAHAVVLALENAKAVGQVYNVGDEQVYTVRQTTDAIADLMEHTWEAVPVPRALWPYGTPYSLAHHIIYDLSKAKIELGYADVVPPHQALRETVEHLVANRPDEPNVLGQTAFNYAAEDAAIDQSRRVR